MFKNRGYITVEGQDAISFLNGLTTNDVSKLQDEKSSFTAFLNPKGKFLFDGFLSKIQEGVLIDTFEGDVDYLYLHLSKYKLRSKGVLKKADQLDPSWRAVWPEPFVKNMSEKDRILAKIPFGPKDVIYEKGFILECGYDELGAIDWKKGCYLGQELVAKTKYRGEIHKKLFLVELDCQKMPSYGALIHTKEGKEAGEVKSISDPFALVMIRLEFLNDQLFVNDNPLSILP